MKGLMTHEDFQKLLKGDLGRYYEGRWEYFKEVIELIKSEKIESALEIGPAQETIIKGCDIMLKPGEDMWGRPKTKAPNEYLHDATEKPWPIKDKQYDLLIALQVWEHLDNKQSRAFREVMRVAKTAIFSFPYMWDCPKDSRNYPAHHMIDEELIGDWTLNIKPEKIIKIPRTGQEISKGPRIIYFWKFFDSIRETQE
jgi:hypothetical protein